MLWYIKMTCLIAFYATIYLTPIPITSATIMLMCLTFLPVVLCTVEEYRIGAKLDKELGR